MRGRTIKRFAVLAGVFVLSLAVVMVSAGLGLAEQKVYKLKCPTIYPAASPSYAGSVLRVAKLLKERSNGRLIVEPFTSGALIPSKEIFNAVERGMVPMGVSVARYFVAKVPLGRVAGGLPFSFGSPIEAEYFYKNLGYEKMLQDVILKKYKMYSWIDRVYPTELAMKKCVTTVADFKGVKLRSSGTIQKLLTKLGAAASYLPGSEVYPALSSGVVDGAHWGGAMSNNDMGFYEICKYHLSPALVYAGTDLWLFNKKAFDSLPKDLQAIITSTIEEHFWTRTAEYTIQNDVALAKIQKDKGVKVCTLTPAAQKEITKAAVDLWKEEASDPETKKAVNMLIKYLQELGRL
ncbi:MAG: TRAP transporter substrate-binding protein DctP [Thermodesulfobacteriota bacterium]